MAESPSSPALQALGRLPSGVYILTARDGSGTRTTGMLASWVQQAGFEPPMVTVAFAKDRFVLDWIKETGRFVLNQIPAGEKGLLKHFGRGFEPDADAFEGLELREDLAAGGPPVLASALAHLIVEPRGEIASSDHVVVLGEVVGGAPITPGDPMVHVRRDGGHY